MSKRITVTDTILRDAHQSLLATRLRTEDMLPICDKLDQVGYWSLEVWGGATFDACVRFLKEDPWERLRTLRKALPNTRLQMLLRGQNLLGYRHYSDDVVRAFVAKAAENGIDVFRIFDAMNDVRNLKVAIEAVKAAGELSYADGVAKERELFMKLMGGTQSAAMRHYFFAERAANKIDDVPKDTQLIPIKKVGVIGAGTMGGGIAMNFLSAGIPVTILEMAQDALDRGIVQRQVQRLHSISIVRTWNRVERSRRPPDHRGIVTAALGPAPERKGAARNRQCPTRRDAAMPAPA